MFPGPPVAAVRFNNNVNDDLEELGSSWEERQRRARSVRLLIMFLTMLLLMDGDPNTRQQQRQNKLSKIKADLNKQDKEHMQKSLTGEGLISKKWRTEQLNRLKTAVEIHPGLLALNEKNAEVQNVEQKNTLEKGEDKQKVATLSNPHYYYYPKNATGHYRGYWTRLQATIPKFNSTTTGDTGVFSSTDLQLRQALLSINESIGVFLLPQGILLKDPLSTTDAIIPEASRSSARGNNLEKNSTSGSAVVHPMTEFVPEFLRLNDLTTSSTQNSLLPLQNHQITPKMHLSSDRGRIVIQLSLHNAPDMQGYLLWVDGYIKLFDHENGGMFITTATQPHSTDKSGHDSPKQTKDASASNVSPVASSLGFVSMRVKGIMVPQIGRISMVGNALSGRSILVVNESKCQPKTSNGNSSDLGDFELITSLDDGPGEAKRSLDTEQSEGEAGLKEIEEIVPKNNKFLDTAAADSEKIHRRILQQQSVTENGFGTLYFTFVPQFMKVTLSLLRHVAACFLDPNHVWSNHYRSGNLTPSFSWWKRNSNANSFIFFSDNKDENLDHRRLQQIESITDIVSPLWLENGSSDASKTAMQSDCEFEVNLDVDPLLFEAPSVTETNEKVTSNNKMKRSITDVWDIKEAESEPTPLQQQQLVVSLSGTIVSPNCNFDARISANALRINWTSITTKAINYSFAMMLICLAQIVLLLRQLLHSQSNFLASRVSMLTIGWQCILDAIWCMIHILFCLVMQPLFTAFASVAFFKLLMFCVIEMKYLQIIEQARLASAGQHVTAERMRRQAAVIQCRFYVGLISMITLYWNLRQYWTFVLVLFHSWWVPQIIKNIITETKQPCHSYYIFGMSFTRLLAPIYMFGFKSNFVREMNPEFPRNVAVCYALLVWVGLQAAMLYLQGKWGARFMIPARFLPPKFDYSRPIPDSMLPSPSSPSRLNSSASDIEVGGSIASGRGSGSRNRINGGSSRHRNVTTIDESPSDMSQTLDCVICYSSIDVHNHRGYMLPPCDHIFHRQCLEQWMEVKLECPICRKTLPPI